MGVSWCIGTRFVSQGWSCWLGHLLYGVQEIALSRSKETNPGTVLQSLCPWITHHVPLNLPCTWGSLLLREGQNHGALIPWEGRAVTEPPSSGTHHYAPHGSPRKGDPAIGTQIHDQCQLKTGHPTDVARAALSNQ